MKSLHTLPPAEVPVTLQTLHTLKETARCEPDPVDPREDLADLDLDQSDCDEPEDPRLGLSNLECEVYKRPTLPWEVATLLVHQVLNTGRPGGTPDNSRVAVTLYLMSKAATAALLATGVGIGAVLLLNGHAFQGTLDWFGWVALVSRYVVFALMLLERLVLRVTTTWGPLVNGPELREIANLEPLRSDHVLPDALASCQPFMISRGGGALAAIVATLGGALGAVAGVVVPYSLAATMDAGGDYSFECTVLWIIGVAVAVLEALGTAVSYDEQRYTDWRFRLANDMPTASEWLVCHLSSLRVSIALYWLAPLGIVFAVYVNT